MFEFREYQQDAIEDVRRQLDRNPILVAPTGSGKTVMAVELIRRLKLRSKVLWLAHRTELIKQAAETLESHGLAGLVGIIKAGFPETPLMPYQVASVQTLVRQSRTINDLDVGLVVIDEAHHAPARSYLSILESIGAPRLGLTATPFRLDGKGLGDLFGFLVIASYTEDLCQAGWLQRPKVWASEAPDLRGIRAIAGDYQLSSMAERINTTELRGDIVKTWKLRAEGKRTVCFAVNVDHSQALSEAFSEAGVKAEHLDGKTPADVRDGILSRLRTGETTVVSNCMVLTEGWDLPALEVAVIARPTASLNLHLQMIGRIMRSCPNKDGAIVLDHAGNHHVHGLVTRRLRYSLGRDDKVGHEDPLGVRRCAECGLLYDIHLRICPDCGWQPSASDRKVGNVNGELTVFDDGDYSYRRQVWNLIEAERQAMSYKEGWSFFRFKERFGDWPVVVREDLVDPKTKDREIRKAVFVQLLVRAKQKNYKPGWASYRYKNYFGVWPRGFVVDEKKQSMPERFNAQQR